MREGYVALKGGFRIETVENYVRFGKLLEVLHAHALKIILNLSRKAKALRNQKEL